MSLDPREILSPFDIDRHARLVIAVSGGSDSLGLLLLAAGFVADAGGLLAVTVDHGLRAQAADEARAVAALCARHDIAHRTMVWEGEKPRTGLIAAAREARYALLAQAARDFGTDTILVGHTMDDQAETVAMRSLRRDQGPGLAGMAGETLFDWRFRIVRPLLCLRRRAIRDFLFQRGVAWIEDPSNDNPAFERVRTRATLSDAEIATLAAQAGVEGRARIRLAEEAAHLVERFATMPAPGLLRLDPPMLSVGAENDAAAVHALRALLGLAGGTRRLPDAARAKALCVNLSSGATRATLSRAVVDRRRSGIWIRREARGLPVLEPGDTPATWDGRWRISSRSAARGLTVAALGAERAGTFSAMDAQVPQSLARAALALEPALFDGGTFFALAGGRRAVDLGVTASPAVAPFAHFLPGFDLALAAALARLVDASAPAVPPWKHHIATGP